MKKHLLLLFIIGLAVTMQAETVVLSSGKTITGEILLQNDDVVLVRDKDGRRYQFMRADVTEIKAEEVVEEVEEQPTPSSHKISLRLDFAGGAAFIPSIHDGGFFGVDMQIGSRQIKGKKIFLGGSIGYTGIKAGNWYNIIPIMAVVSVPLMEGKHAPEIGVGLGYGAAVKKPELGGICSRIDLSWRYQFSDKHALLLGVRANFQQAKVEDSELMPDGISYTKKNTHNIVTVGVRMGIAF